MDFDSVPEDLSLCEPHWWSKATAGELPSGEGSLHEARLVGVGDNYCWIDENLAEIVFFMWKLGIKTESTCHNLYEADDEVFTMQLDSGPKEYVRPKICFINFDAPHHHNLQLFLNACFSDLDHIGTEMIDVNTQPVFNPDGDYLWDITAGRMHINFEDSMVTFLRDRLAKAAAFELGRIFKLKWNSGSDDE